MSFDIALSGHALDWGRRRKRGNWHTVLKLLHGSSISSAGAGRADLDSCVAATAAAAQGINNDTYPKFGPASRGR